MKKQLCEIKKGTVKLLGESTKYESSNIHIIVNGLDLSKVWTMHKVEIIYDNGLESALEESTTWRNKLWHLIKR